MHTGSNPVPGTDLPQHYGEPGRALPAVGVGGALSGLELWTREGQGEARRGPPEPPGVGRFARPESLPENELVRFRLERADLPSCPLRVPEFSG